MSEIYPDTDGKQDKEAVGYSPAFDKHGEVGGEACGRCEHYRARPWRTSGVCEKVEGAINGRYWCRLYRAR